MRKVVVVDYGFGNLPSVIAALREIGLDPLVDSQGEFIQRGDLIFLPGVASFGPAKRRLDKSGQSDQLRQAYSKERLIIGLCLGAQLLMESSEEAPREPGFGFVQGQVVRLDAEAMTVPNQGWHRLCAPRCGRSLLGNQTRETNPYAYFSHSYQIDLADETLQTSLIRIHGFNVTASYEVDNVRGFQFHPELSGQSGLQLLHQVATSLG